MPQNALLTESVILCSQTKSEMAMNVYPNKSGRNNYSHFFLQDSTVWKAIKTQWKHLDSMIIGYTAVKVKIFNNCI